jgi:O-antigen ligase
LQQSATTTPTSRTIRPDFFPRAIEAAWLFAAFFVPVIVMHERVMVGFIQIPKVFVFRSMGLALIALLILEWAFTTFEGGGRADVRGIPRRAWESLRVHPARFIVYGAGAVLAANLVSLAFSPVRSIGIWGIDPGWDTYGLYNVALHVVFFGVLAARLRTREQIERLIWTVTAGSIIVSVYGVAQHFGIDPFRNVAVPAERSGLTFGNPIFGAAYLILTVPLTLAVFLPLRDRMAAVSHVWIGSGLIATQLTAVAFTFSRGPWVAFAFGALAFFVAIAWVFGAKAARRPVAIVAVAVAIVVMMNLLPVRNAPDGNFTFGETVTSIGPDIAGGLNNRWTIWKTSIDVFLTTPWVDTDQSPDIPELIVPWLRPVVGYGPEMFGYAYPLAGDSVYTRELASHGHNFIVHTAVELGILGVAAYLFLLGAVGALLLSLLRKAKAGAYPEWFSYLIVAISGAFVARVIEQIPGKAQVSDLHLMWMLIGLVVVMVVIGPALEAGPRGETSETAPNAARRRARRPRRDQRRPAAVNLSMARVAAASVVALVIGVFWFQTVVNEVRAAFIARDAEDAAEQGLANDAIIGYGRAIELAPTAASNMIHLGQIFMDVALSGDRELADRVRLLELATSTLDPVFKRNPLDHRAWSRAGEFQRELAAIDPAVTADAIYRNEALVSLMPGFWQARTALAWSLVRLDQFEAGLEVVQDAKDIGVLDATGAYLAYYIQASALAGMGAVDEARSAAHCSIAHRPTNQANEVLARLGEVVEDDLVLTEADFAVCPEIAAKLLSR